MHAYVHVHGGRWKGQFFHPFKKIPYLNTLARFEHHRQTDSCLILLFTPYRAPVIQVTTFKENAEADTGVYIGAYFFWKWQCKPDTLPLTCHDKDISRQPQTGQGNDLILSRQ